MVAIQLSGGATKLGNAYVRQTVRTSACLDGLNFFLFHCPKSELLQKIQMASAQKTAQPQVDEDDEVDEWYVVRRAFCSC
jgi:hypothetical protein